MLQLTHALSVVFFLFFFLSKATECNVHISVHTLYLNYIKTNIIQSSGDFMSLCNKPLHWHAAKKVSTAKNPQIYSWRKKLLLIKIPRSSHYSTLNPNVWKMPTTRDWDIRLKKTGHSPRTWQRSSPNGSDSPLWEVYTIPGGKVMDFPPHRQWAEQMLEEDSSTSREVKYDCGCTCVYIKYRFTPVLGFR